MRITKRTLAMGYTVNLGNYESVRFDVSAEAELDPDGDFDAQTAELNQQVRVELLANMTDTLLDISSRKLKEVERRLGLVADEEVHATEDKNDFPF